jgi:hypothetical protein
MVTTAGDDSTKSMPPNLGVQKAATECGAGLLPTEARRTGMGSSGRYFGALGASTLPGIVVFRPPLQHAKNRKTSILISGLH